MPAAPISRIITGIRRRAPGGWRAPPFRGGWRRRPLWRIVSGGRVPGRAAAGGQSVGGRAGLDRIVKWQRAARPVLGALAAGAALHPAIAAALANPAGGAPDAAPWDAAGLAVAAALLAAVIVLAALLVAARRRLAAGERARADQAAALAAAEALLGAAPLASFRWRLADGGESYAPGLLTALRFADTPRFAALIELLAPEDTQFLVAATVALRADGTPFALTLGLRAGGAVDAIGRRVRDAGGHAVVDVVWIADAGRRAAALADAVDRAAETALLRATLDALPLPVWRRGAGDLA